MNEMIRGKGTVRARGTDGARVIQVIKTISLRGAGIEDGPARYVTQYWDFEGKLLAENDDWEKEVIRKKGRDKNDNC